MTGAGFSDNLKMLFKKADVLLQFIYINIGIFIIIRISILICKLFNVEAGSFLNYLELPSSFFYFIRRPWTILTYMFLHYDLLHILFNMLWLYWFGKIFLIIFNGRQLGGLYVLSGIGGGLFYMLAFTVFPYFDKLPDPSYLLGASASVLAIVVAPAVAAPNFQLRLLIFGNIRLKYIAIATILLDVYFWSKNMDDAGSHIAHLGGALIGVWFALCLPKGKDITSPVNHLIDKLVIFFSPKPKMTVTYNNSNRTGQTRQETDPEYNARKKREEEELNRILDKLKKSGYESLSPDEKKNLFNAGK